jgi:hypothetical protein
MPSSRCNLSPFVLLLPLLLLLLLPLAVLSGPSATALMLLASVLMGVLGCPCRAACMPCSLHAVQPACCAACMLCRLRTGPLVFASGPVKQHSTALLFQSIKSVSMVQPIVLVLHGGCSS